MTIDKERLITKILPCPFTGEIPRQGRTKMRYCQIHGDKLQNYFIESSCCRIERPTRELAIKAWNTRTDILKNAEMRDGETTMTKTLSEQVAQLEKDLEEAKAKLVKEDEKQPVTVGFEEPVLMKYGKIVTIKNGYEIVTSRTFMFCNRASDEPVESGKPHITVAVSIKYF